MPKYTRECLAIRVRRKLKPVDVVEMPSDLLILRGVPTLIRLDHGPESVAGAVRERTDAVGTGTVYIERRVPRQKGACKSFTGRFRAERLNADIFHSLRKARIIIEEWRCHDNKKRPHGALGYYPLASGHSSGWNPLSSGANILFVSLG